MTTFPSALNHVWHPPQSLGELRKSTFFFGRQNSTNWLFSNLSPRFRCVTSFTPPGPISHLRFYFDICEWRVLSARAWTPAFMLHLTNPCAKRKVLTLTKPKGRIYKTKFLGHYITLTQLLDNSFKQGCVHFCTQLNGLKFCFVTITCFKLELIY